MPANMNAKNRNTQRTEEQDLAFFSELFAVVLDLFVDGIGVGLGLAVRGGRAVAHGGGELGGVTEGRTGLG